MKNWINFALFISIISLFSCNKHDDPNAQTNKEIMAIDNYLAANSINNALVDGFGSRIVIQQFGEDAPAHTGQIVKVSYIARLFSDGSIFDEGVINSNLENVTGSGLQSVISGLMKGSKAIAYVPSKYAFGASGTNVVPPNSTIIYQVSLDDVIRTSSEQSQFNIDTTAIQKYISDNNITNVVKHTSGVRYTVDASGTGTQPTVYNSVNLHFKGSILSNGSVFQESDLTGTNIFGLIDGLKVGLPLMTEGA